MRQFISSLNQLFLDVTTRDVLDSEKPASTLNELIIIAVGLFILSVLSCLATFWLLFRGMLDHNVFFYLAFFIMLLVAFGLTFQMFTSVFYVFKNTFRYIGYKRRQKREAKAETQVSEA